MAMSKFSRKRVPDVVSNSMSPMEGGGGDCLKIVCHIEMPSW